MTITSRMKRLAYLPALLLLPAAAHAQQASQGYITLQNAWQNGFLSATGNTASQNADAKVTGTHWIMVPAGSKSPGAFKLKSPDGKFLHLEGGTLEVSAPKPNWGANTDLWMMESAGNANMRIKNIASQTSYLNNEKGSVAAGAIQPGWQSAIWSIQVTLTIDNVSSAPLDVFVEDDSGTPQLMATIPVKNRLVQLTPPSATWRVGQNDQWVGEIKSSTNPNQHLVFPASGGATQNAGPSGGAASQYGAIPAPGPAKNGYQAVPGVAKSQYGTIPAPGAVKSQYGSVPKQP